MWKIIGYGSQSSIFPLIPDFLCIENSEGGLPLKYINKSNPMILSGTTEPSEFTRYHGNSIFIDNIWVCVESESTMSTFLCSEERQFRSKRAQELVHGLQSSHDGPMRVLELTQAAGVLQGVDVPGLVRRLQLSKEKPEETLDQIMTRLRNTIK